MKFHRFRLLVGILAVVVIGPVVVACIFGSSHMNADPGVYANQTNGTYDMIRLGTNAGAITVFLLIPIGLLLEGLSYWVCTNIPY